MLGRRCAATAPPPRNWWRWRPGYGIGMWPG